MSEQGDLSDRSQPDLYWECVKGALADAGLTLADVDGLIGPAAEGTGIREALPGGAVADALGHSLRFHAATGVGASSQSAGVGLAALAVAHGMAEVVIVPTAAAGGVRDRSAGNGMAGWCPTGARGSNAVLIAGRPGRADGGHDGTIRRMRPVPTS